jgi:putative ABC transport system substrate-binding protein
VIFLGLRRIAELAVQSRLPSISPFSPYPASGGLMAYGPDFKAMWHQLGGYVDRVLRGAHAGDIPVERPSKFSLIVNLKTAKAIRLAISPSLRARADQVIE